MPRIFFLVSLLLLALAACAPNRNRSGAINQPLAAATPATASLRAGDQDASLTIGRRERSYVVHLPPAINAQRNFPLVIVLHGGGGSDDNVARMSGMSVKADQEGFITVYPNGTGRLEDKLLTWNSGNCCGYALDNQIDDVGFIRALVEKLQRDYPIDPRRIYATGISNGGMMSYRLACEASDIIAAVAPVAGALNVECKPSQPVSVIAFNGMLDEHVLFNGGAPKKSIDSHTRIDNSVPNATSFWTQYDRCGLSPQHTDSGSILRDEYSGCANGTSVVLYAIKNGGHAWPGGQRGSFLGDVPTPEISATDLMWEFFVTHPKP